MHAHLEQGWGDWRLQHGNSTHQTISTIPHLLPRALQPRAAGAALLDYGALRGAERIQGHVQGQLCGSILPRRSCSNQLPQRPKGKLLRSAK